MRRFFFLYSALLALWLVGGGSGQANDKPLFQPMDVFELEWASDPQISPSGEQIVYVRNSMDVMKDRRQSQLWIINFDGTGHRPLTSNQSDESSPRWSPDGTKLLYLSRADGNQTQLYLRWMDSGQTAQLTQTQKPPRSPVWSPDGEWIAFTMLVPQKPPQLAGLPEKPKGAEWAEPPVVIDRLRHRADGVGDLEPGYNHLFVLPAEGGTPRQVSSGAYHHSSAPVWTPDSRSLLFSANRNPGWEHQFRNSEIYRLSLEDGEILPLTDRDGPDTSPSVSPDGQWVAYLGYPDRIQTYQVSRLHLMKIDGSGKRVVTETLDRSLRSPEWDSRGEGIFFQYDDLGSTKIGYVTTDGHPKVIAGNLGGTSIGRPYGGGSFSVAGDGRYVFTQTRPHHPAELAVGRFDQPGQRRITDLNRDLLGQRRLAEVEEFWFQSSFDGRRIQGWQARPPGFDPGKKYPLILEIHGGPIANYGDRFSAEIQLYAAAGYMVLYVNPRGSTGYGEEFGNLLHHHYPGNDYDDLMSAVETMVQTGSIDPERLYVTGGSAGGIMTAWMVGKTNRFRAAVSAKPVINWYSKVLVADNYYAYHRYRYPGYVWENPEVFLKYSPISLVGNVRTPTLLMTGDADLRTPISEAEQFYHALKLRKVDTALVRLPGASHNIARRPSQLIAKVAHVLAWFEKYH